MLFGGGGHGLTRDDEIESNRGAEGVSLLLQEEVGQTSDMFGGQVEGDKEGSVGVVGVVAVVRVREGRVDDGSRWTSQGDDLTIYQS